MLRSSCMRSIRGQVCLAILGLSGLAGSSAFAETAPVVAVNREIGLSITGSFQDALSSETTSYVGTTYTSTGRTRSYESGWNSDSRRIGWTPGCRTDREITNIILLRTLLPVPVPLTHSVLEAKMTQKRRQRAVRLERASCCFPSRCF